MTTQTKETTQDNFSSFELVNKDNYFLWTLYDRSEEENNDQITKEGFAKWTSAIKKRNISIKEYLNMYPSVSLMTTNAALRLQEKHYQKKYNAFKPYVITKELYNEMLNVLPPEEWYRDYDCLIDYFESFKLIECIAENLYNYYSILKLNNKTRYFKITLPNKTEAKKIKNLCIKHFKKLEGVKNEK